MQHQRTTKTVENNNHHGKVDPVVLFMETAIAVTVSLRKKKRKKDRGGWLVVLHLINKRMYGNDKLKNKNDQLHAI